MKKTFVTVMPNHIGAFLKASRCFAALGLNITRISYNKAVDTHTLFIDAEGPEALLEKAGEELKRIGYTQQEAREKTVALLEFRLPNAPGSVIGILELISSHQMNISYMSAQDSDPSQQLFKVGLVIENQSQLDVFLSAARKLCEVRQMDYNPADKVFDNSVFYNTFVNELYEAMDLSEQSKTELLINTNLAMQNLDELGFSPYRAFSSISRFTDLLSKSREELFQPRVTEHTITENTRIVLIEPPCGSNIAILQSGGNTLFVDTGYACHEKEALEVIRRYVPDFDTAPKQVLITHPDLDHCGLLPLFDRIYASAKSAECLRLEYENQEGFREKLRLHQPYVRICKILTSYRPPNPVKFSVIGNPAQSNDPLAHVGYFDFGDLHFELLEGQGGHVAGELVLIDYEHKVAFTGDIFINLKDMTPEQAEYNRYAPILMTSVDTDKTLCTQERQAIFQRLGVGQWQIFCGHGGKVSYTVASQSN
ncbi:MAG: MBL fold metallo-hydrolase [Oscillospiraceae bacterium]|nr:MBL fold metallo-hydrolase [Oscillospiraceae bacterium]